MGILSFLFAHRKDLLSDDNQIDGLQDRGLAQHSRHLHTEFGSGWQGPKHPSFEEGLLGPDLPAPKKPNLVFQRLEQGFVTHASEDFSESLPYYLLPEIEKQSGKKILPFLVRHWKVATAAALVGLYALKPLSLFSGRDDESNTLEGLRHGGLSQRMRRDMTPFGSGWDPLRQIAQEAGTTLEKLVRTPNFRLAMASGDVVSKLGEGTFGTVHLMESSIKIGEKEHSFQYALKQVKNGDYSEIFHEVKAQRKLQDLNAPSVYGWSGNNIYMEPIHGVGASQYMRSGKQLPESFMKDLEQFFPEMHRRGMVHRDIGRDVNRFVRKEGKMGEILPHNIMLTPEGRAAVIDYGTSSSASSNSPVMHQLYNREKYTSDKEFDLALVHSLRRNKGKLSAEATEAFKQYHQAFIPPSSSVLQARTVKAKIRSANQASATKNTARELFRVGSGRRSKSVFSATRKV